VVFTRTGRAGLGTPPARALDADAFDAHTAELADAGAARVLADEGLLVTSPPGFWAAEGPQGTEIRPGRPKKGD
jgi:hypothetical protein